MTCHVLSCKANDETEHCQATIPVFCERGETDSFALLFHDALNLNEVNKVLECNELTLHYLM